MGKFSEDCTLSFSSSLCSVTGIQQRRVCGAEEPFQPKDLAWLDSCDKHRNEGPGKCRHYKLDLWMCKGMVNL